MCHFVPFPSHFVPFRATLCHSVLNVFMRTVYRSRTHGAFFEIFECRVRKIISCCHGKCGGSRPLRGCRVGRGTRPTRTALGRSAQPPRADADLGGWAPRIANGPWFATPGAGQIVKEQMHAPSIQAWLNCLHALYTLQYARNLAPIARGTRTCVASPIARCTFGILTSVGAVINRELRFKADSPGCPITTRIVNATAGPVPAERVFLTTTSHGNPPISSPFACCPPGGAPSGSGGQHAKGDEEMSRRARVYPPQSGEDQLPHPHRGDQGEPCTA